MRPAADLAGSFKQKFKIFRNISQNISRVVYSCSIMHNMIIYMIGKHFTQEMELMEAIDVGLYTEGGLLVYSPLFGQNLKTDYLF
jgi:hypothetical protein